MRITHDVRSTGHFVTIHHDNVTLTIRTEHGTDSELAVEAAEMRKKANRLIRNADIIKEAIHGGGVPMQRTGIAFRDTRYTADRGYNCNKDRPLKWQCDCTASLENLANARLIAAAPELLEAAQLVIDSWSSGDLAAAVRQLADAVVEATGA